MDWNLWVFMAVATACSVGIVFAGNLFDSGNCADACEADGRVGHNDSGGCWCLEADGSAFKPKPKAMPAPEVCR